MTGEILQVWASVALTYQGGRYYVWAPAEGDDYKRNIQPAGFASEREARDYANVVTRGGAPDQ